MSARGNACMSPKPTRLAAAALSFFGTGLLAPVLGPSLTPSATAAPAAVSAVPWTPREASLLHRVAVFGSDERVPLPQSLRSVGDKIGVLHDPRSHSVCTAFCVARDIVATAAHCLYRTSDVPPLHLTDLTLKLHGSHTTARIAGAAEGAPEPNVVAG